MSTSGLTAFESTVHTTNVWLHDLMDRLNWQDKHRAYHALRIVLQALRDRLPVDQVAALGAQLPMLVRGFYYEGWHPAGKPLKERRKEDFLAHIEEGFQGEPITDPEEVARAVFQVLAKHVTPGEIKHIKITLPAELREFFTAESRSMWF